jgi:hypothetical protein
MLLRQVFKHGLYPVLRKELVVRTKAIGVSR